MKIVALLAVLFTGALLLSATGDFPAWGDAESPANDNRLSKHYVTKTYEETEVPNMVTAVLADYRGFDTMFETVVVFTAGIGILAVLRVLPGEGPRVHVPKEKENLIVAITCKLSIPVLQLFALYVVAHGHHSPGGGFQGGVMFGASYILLAISFGLPAAFKRLSERRAISLAVLGVLIYAGFGVVSMLLGQNFLDYGVLNEIMPGTGEEMARSHSMLGVEIGVAFTVCCIMFCIYAALSTKGRMEGGL